MGWWGNFRQNIARTASTPWIDRATQAYQQGHTGWGNFYCVMEAIGEAVPRTPVVGSFAQHGFTLFADTSATGAQQAFAAGGLTLDFASLIGFPSGLAAKRASVLTAQARSLPNLLGVSKANLLFRAKVLGSLGKTLTVASHTDFFASQVPKYLPHIKQTWSNVDVGGILFNKSADVLTNVAEIVGAYWDTKTDSLVLIGKAKQKSELVSMGLPSMDQDHLLVALRASIAGQPIGVSIDPPSEYRDGIKRGVNPPDGTPMLVSYLGGTENTLFGAIMFEADRLLKCLDKGVHNETKKPIRATVHGFKPLLERISPGDERPTNVWHRFWFVIDKVELKHDPDTDAIVFGDVRLKVLTETEMDDHPQDKYIDPADEAFTQHLTENYDEYAKDFPILARLKELAKIAAVAKFLCNRKISLDLETLFSTSPQCVDTPSTTPGISVTSPNVEVRQEGTVTYTRTISLFGGVNMDAKPHILPDDGSAKQLKYLAESVRPSKHTSSWAFKKEGVLTTALAIRVGQQHTPFRKICEDHEFPSSNANNLFQLRRVYDSVSRGEGNFGHGWSLWLPFSLTVIQPSRKRSEVLTRQESKTQHGKPILVLHDHTLHTSNIYRWIEAQANMDRGKFCKVISQTVNDGGTSFQYDPSDCFFIEGETFSLNRNNCKYYFDPNGHLMEIRTNNCCLVQYYRENERIVRIENNTGYVYDITYDQSGSQRIVEVKASDGRHIHYLYDELGYLASYKNGKEGRENYAYDTRGRLTEIRSQSGRVISRNVYDDFNNQLTESSDMVATLSGKKLWRSFHQGRIVSAKDETGATLDYKYGRQQELSLVEIKNPSGQTWGLRYDNQGRLTSLRDPMDRVTRLYYDQFGKVTRMLDPDDKLCSFQRDEEGRLVGLTDQNGHQWTAKYNDNGSLQAISASTGEQWAYEYDGNMLVKAHGPAGEVRVTLKKDILTIQRIASNGMWQKQVFNRNLQLMECQAKDAKELRFQYDHVGNICSIQNEVGIVNYTVNEKERMLTIAFQG